MDATTTVAGIPIPSTSPWFLGVVGVHVALGLVAVIAGAGAMLSKKRRGRHSTLGTVYFRALLGIFVTSTALSLARWAEDDQLFVLGVLAFAAAWFGRRSARRGSAGWAPFHVVGMGLSYIFLLTAFYVDNGKNLPLWRELPSLAYWLLPAALGVPLIVYTLLRHPVVHRGKPVL
jgi:hypothetical protein